MMLKIEKKVLAEALMVLGKMVSRLSPVAAQRALRFEGRDGLVRISATDGVELVTVELNATLKEAFEALVPFAELKKALGNGKTGEIILSIEAGVATVGEVVRGRLTEKTFLAVDLAEWPEREVVPEATVRVALPEGVVGMLAHAAQIVNRQEARSPLRGINLSRDGITATDGKQLLNIPVPLELDSDVTIPFPLALLTANPGGPGTLAVWQSKQDRLSEIKVGNGTWYGKVLSGNYPNWRQVMPSIEAMDYTAKITDREGCVEFLRKIPDCPPHHAVELHFQVDCMEMVSRDFPELKRKFSCDFSGKLPTSPLVLNKYALIRIFHHGHDTIRACQVFAPVLASGGMGNLLVMPINCKPVIINQQPVKEKPEMEVKTEPTKVEITSEPVNVMDELNHGLDELRLKLKTLLDESAFLTRKVKEAALQQKQKEREFIQARRAIERIKMVSGF
jgi:DNA polymerase III sliding clamp (beta) subunit (PCNA family)